MQDWQQWRPVLEKYGNMDRQGNTSFPKIHNRSEHLDAVQGAKGAKEAGRGWRKHHVSYREENTQKADAEGIC